MKHLLGLVLVLLVSAFLAQGAWAAGPDPMRPETEVAGASQEDLTSVYNYFPTAQAMGMDWASFVHVTPERTQMTIEYLPDGQISQNWTRMVTVTLTYVGQDPVAATAALAQTIGNMQGLLQRSGADVKAFDRLASAQESAPPRAFFHYVLDGEENAGIALLDMGGFSVIVQSQARGGASVPVRDIDFLRKTVHGE